MNKRNSFYRDPGRSSPAGSGCRARYVKDCTTNPPILKKVGETDQQALIQSFADQCDVNRIVQRFEAGDSSVLGRVQGLYADVSGYPTDAVSLMNLGAIATSAWDSLTLEEQTKYGSMEAFIDAVLNPSVNQPVSDPAPDPAPNNSEEVIE